jgi:hypothetical protein
MLEKHEPLAQRAYWLGVMPKYAENGGCSGFDR